MSRPRVLVVDDEDIVRALIARALPDCDVLSASDGLGAVAAARALAPDLILLDLTMPRQDGWAALRELRQSPTTRSIPVIIVSGQGAECARVGGLGMGADDYVVKPFSPLELAARVARLLERRAEDLSAQPLTGLPGSPAIEREVGRRLRAGLSLALMHADIDRFKAFNDRYGFERGDRAIKAAAEVLVAAAGADAFVGHVGGDDFALVCAAGEAEAVARRAAELFDARAPELYDAADCARGWIGVRDRAGRRRRFALMTLSIGGATNARRTISCYAQAAQLAAEMKAYLKSRGRRRASLFAFDRRAR